jgi:hypothetical protein
MRKRPTHVFRYVFKKHFVACHVVDKQFYGHVRLWDIDDFYADFCMNGLGIVFKTILDKANVVSS